LISRHRLPCLSVAYCATIIALWLLLELNGDDLRREPLEVRKATLASVLAKTSAGLRLNEHLEHPACEAVRREAEEDWGR
jgi:ATP-dependent DNA ligase